MSAYEYPLIGAFWTLTVAAGLVVLLYLLFRIFADLFRNPDLGPVAKVLWLLFVILVPVIGIAAYIGLRAHQMSQHDVRAARAKRLRQEAAGGSRSTSWYDL